MNSGGKQLEPDGYSDELSKYILGAFDGNLPMTLRDLYRTNPKYSWQVFMEGVSRLVSEGYLEGKGDGFVVHYSLSNKGRAAVGELGPSNPNSKT